MSESKCRMKTTRGSWYASFENRERLTWNLKVVQNNYIHWRLWSLKEWTHAEGSGGGSPRARLNTKWFKFLFKKETPANFLLRLWKFWPKIIENSKITRSTPRLEILLKWKIIFFEKLFHLRRNFASLNDEHDHRMGIINVAIFLVI